MNTHFAGAPTGSEGVSPPQEAAGGRQAGEAARVSPSCVASEEAQFRALSGSRGGAQPTRRSAEHVGSLPPDDNSVRYRRLRRRRRNCNSRRSPRCSRFAHSALRHSFIKASMHRASHVAMRHSGQLVVPFIDTPLGHFAGNLRPDEPTADDVTHSGALRRWGG